MQVSHLQRLLWRLQNNIIYPAWREPQPVCLRTSRTMPCLAWIDINNDCKAPSWNINEKITSHLHIYSANICLWTQEQTHNASSRARPALSSASVVVTHGGTGNNREAGTMSLPLVYSSKFEQLVIYGFPEVRTACQLSFLIAISQPIFHEFM